MNEPLIDEVQRYWSGKNVPQQWYSDKEPFSLQWFNEIRQKRYELYYEYLKEEAEFQYHTGERVLEVGVGIGTDLAEFAMNGAKVSGIDLGEDQVNLTKLNFHLRNLPYDQICQGNAEELGFEDKTFDLVYSFGVLHHTPDTEKAIDEVKRVLKDDGQAIIMLYAKGFKHYIKRCFIHGILLGKFFKNGFSWKKVYNEVSEVHGNAPKTGVYSKAQIKRMFSVFSQLEIRKKRLGEFIEYPPYRTFVLPGFVKRFMYFFNFECFWGENWLIKASCAKPPKKVSVFEVIFKHY